MFEAVITIQTNQEAARFFFYGLAIVGGVFGAFLPPIGRLSRLPYFGLTVLIYLVSLGIGYAVGLSLNVPLIFSGYLFSGLLSGVAIAWIARARSADIVGDGRYSIFAFIPLLGLYLIFAKGHFDGERVTKSEPKGAKFGLGLAAILGGLLAFGSLQTPAANGENQFAKDVAASVTPERLDDVTLLLGAEAVGRRVKIFHRYEGPIGSLTSNSLEQIRLNVCSDTDINNVFSQAGVDREFIYLDENDDMIGSFLADC